MKVNFKLFEEVLTRLKAWLWHEYRGDEPGMRNENQHERGYAQKG